MKTSLIERSLSWIIRVLGGGVLVNLLSSFLLDTSKLGTVITVVFRLLPATVLVLLAWATLPSGALGPSKYGGSNLSRVLSVVLVLGYIFGSASLAVIPSWYSLVSILCLWSSASLVTWRSFTAKYAIRFTLALMSNLLLCAGLAYIGIALMLRVEFVEGVPYLISSIALLIFILSPIFWEEYPWRWTGLPPLMLCISGAFWGMSISNHAFLVGVMIAVVYGLSSFLMTVVGIIVIIAVSCNELTNSEKREYREGIIRIYGITIGLMVAVGCVSLIALHVDWLLTICGILGLIASALIPLPYLANISVADRVGFVLLVTSPLALLCGLEGCNHGRWLLGVSLLCHGCVGVYTGLVYFTTLTPCSLKEYGERILVWLQKKPNNEVFSPDVFVEGEDDQGCGGDRGDGSGIEGDVS